MTSDYLDLFRSEAREHINHIQQILLDLEEQPEDSNLCKELLQILHTLKGDANLVNKKHIANLAHGLEDTIKEVQAGRLSLRKSGFVLISQKVELLSDYVEAKQDPLNIEINIQESLDQLHQLNQGLLSTTRMIFRPSHDDLFSAISEEIKPLNLRESEDLMKPPKASLEALKPSIFLPETSPKPSPDTSEFLPPPKTEDPESPPSTNTSAAVDPSASRTDTNSLKKPRTDSKLYHSLAGQESLRISMKKIDDLIDLMGEIAIIKDKLENKLWQSSKILEDLKQLSVLALDPITERYTQFYDEFSQDVTALELVTNELKIQSVDVKMIPLSTILTESYTLLRNKSLEMGKNVAPLQVIGGETKVDKSLLESLRKMLIHLILNALSHGIEFEAERIKQGKPPIGILKISAFTKSDTILIEVEDDGREIVYVQVDGEQLRSERINAFGLTIEEPRRDAFLGWQRLLLLGRRSDQRVLQGARIESGR
ncbi:MAG: Hpt domain-containing protein, partial [Planctomycetota bacterium]